MTKAEFVEQYGSLEMLIQYVERDLDADPNEVFRHDNDDSLVIFGSGEYSDMVDEDIRGSIDHYYWTEIRDWLNNLPERSYDIYIREGNLDYRLPDDEDLRWMMDYFFEYTDEYFPDLFNDENEEEEEILTLDDGIDWYTDSSLNDRPPVPEVRLFAEIVYEEEAIEIESDGFNPLEMITESHKIQNINVDPNRSGLQVIE